MAIEKDFTVWEDHNWNLLVTLVLVSAIIGGVGDVASALATSFLSEAHDIVIGVFSFCLEDVVQLVVAFLVLAALQAVNDCMPPLKFLDQQDAEQESSRVQSPSMPPDPYANGGGGAHGPNPYSYGGGGSNHGRALSYHFDAPWHRDLQSQMPQPAAEDSLYSLDKDTMNNDKRTTRNVMDSRSDAEAAVALSVTFTGISAFLLIARLAYFLYSRRKAAKAVLNAVAPEDSSAGAAPEPDEEKK